MLSITCSSAWAAPPSARVAAVAAIMTRRVRLKFVMVSSHLTFAHIGAHEWSLNMQS